MIVGRLLELYLLCAMAIVVHECCHAFIAICIKVKIVDMRIGEGLFAIKLGRFRISPLVCGGFVEVKEDDLLKRRKAEIVFFFLAGSMGNLLLFGVTFIFYAGYSLINYVILVNITIVILSSFPLIKKNDVSSMIAVIKKKGRVR